MRIAILDPAAGMSGDMTLGALLDAGVEATWLEGLPARLGFASVAVRISRVDRGSVAATKVDFAIAAHDPEHGRRVGELIELVRGAPVSDHVRTTAIRAFELLGEAEGRVHGVAAGEVHLHEVGAVDAVLDIVGAIEGFERLGVEAVYNLPVALGDGWVEAAHGRLPVPAPATALLLEGFEVRTGGPVVGEATTPTGAVLLKVLSRGAPPPRWRMAASGWGAGQRDPKGYPGALRLMVAVLGVAHPGQEGAGISAGGGAGPAGGGGSGDRRAIRPQHDRGRAAVAHLALHPAATGSRCGA
jgi:uncharacterized protein (TIGR00299 family) protein